MTVGTDWHFGVSLGVWGTGGWTTLSVSQQEVLRDEFEDFLGGSLKAFRAHESTYGPSQKTSGHESSFSVALLGPPTDLSFHEWLFSAAVASFLWLTNPLIQMLHIPSLVDCSSPLVSSVSVPLGNTFYNLWLGKHLTKHIPFQI